MKQSGRTLKQRLYGLKNLPSRVARARYFRGHGVHSPYVYQIVRQVFMSSHLKPGDRSLYEALIQLEAPKRRAIELQNLMIHCGYSDFSINSLEPQTRMALLMSDLSEEQTLVLVARGREQGVTMVLARPYACRERNSLMRRIIEEHPSTSVDNRGYLLLFNNHLPKQHYRL